MKRESCVKSSRDAPSLLKMQVPLQCMRSNCSDCIINVLPRGTTSGIILNHSIIRRVLIPIGSSFCSVKKVFQSEDLSGCYHIHVPSGQRLSTCTVKKSILAESMIHKNEPAVKSLTPPLLISVHQLTHVHVSKRRDKE
jgi:hypothetical protein